MRDPEEQGSGIWCDRCGEEAEGSYYRINGETICEDCLTEFAREEFAPYREEVKI